MEVRII